MAEVIIKAYDDGDAATIDTTYNPILFYGARPTKAQVIALIMVNAAKIADDINFDEVSYTWTHNEKDA